MSNEHILRYTDLAAVIQMALLLQHIFFERPQQIVGGLVQQSSLGFGAGLFCRFHSLNLP